MTVRVNGVSSLVVKAVAAGVEVIMAGGLFAKMVVEKTRGPSGEPCSVLEFLIGDDCVEGVVPERGGDSKTWREKGRYI